MRERFTLSGGRANQSPIVHISTSSAIGKHTRTAPAAGKSAPTGLSCSHSARDQGIIQERQIRCPMLSHCPQGCHSWVE